MTKILINRKDKKYVDIKEYIEAKNKKWQSIRRREPKSDKREEMLDMVTERPPITKLW